MIHNKHYVSDVFVYSGNGGTDPNNLFGKLHKLGYVQDRKNTWKKRIEEVTHFVEYKGLHRNRHTWHLYAGIDVRRNSLDDLKNLEGKLRIVGALAPHSFSNSLLLYWKAPTAAAIGLQKLSYR